MKKPLISIGIPFYNCEKTLLDAVRSIFAQTMQDWELLLVDDGSSDKGLELARSIDDPRVKVFSDGVNKKLSARLNQITSLATGRYVARMDGDDMCSLDRIERQIRLIESDSRIDVVGTGICYLDKSDKPIGHRFLPSLHSEICKNSPSIDLCHASIIAKKEWFIKFPYNEKKTYAADFGLFFRSYQNSNFRNVPEPLYYYRLDQSYSLKKQIMARQIAANLLFSHYSARGQYGVALVRYMYQYAKLVASSGFCLLGLRKKLLARRFNTLSEADYHKYSSELATIHNLPLPLKLSSK
jgi:glycosyltransferase involved in cell wall biosynthesis